MLEFQLFLAFLFLPVLVGGIRLGAVAFTRLKCAHLGFLEARSDLLRSGTKVDLRKDCGHGIRERIRLLPLEALDRSGERPGFPSWAPLSSSWPSPEESDWLSEPDISAP